MKAFWRAIRQSGETRAQAAMRETRPERERRAAPLMLALEPRLMFDAAVAAIAADAVVKTSVPDTTAPPEASHTATADKPAADKTTENSSAANNVTSAASAASAANGSTQRHDIVFIDGKLSDSRQVAAALPQGTEVVILDGSKDGLAQMAAYLAGRHDIDSISLISHGSTGAVQAGSVWLTSDTLAAHADALRSIGAALSENGDLLLYGCKVGADQAGQQFLDQLAALTLADVAASTDNTGASALGGNWILERHTGAIEAPSLAGALAGYDGLLVAPGYETFDGLTLPDDGGRHRFLSPAQDLLFNGWTFGLRDYSGNADAGSQLVATNQMVDTTLADDNIDKALIFLGSSSTYAAVIKSTNGEEFSFHSITVEDYASGNLNYRLVGYRDGVQVSGASLNFTMADYGTTYNGQVVSVSGTAWQYVDEVRIVYQNGSGGVSLAMDDLNVSAGIAPNVPPVISNLNGDSVTYIEGNSPVLLDPGSNAIVTDSDSTDFSGGNLTVTIVTNNYIAQDRLMVVDQGSGAGQIGVSGSNIQYGGTTIGTVSGGSGGASLVVTFNANANLTAVQALLRDIAYSNSSSDPSEALRTVQFTLNDGDSPTNSAGSRVTVDVKAVNNAPTLTTTAGNTTYTENAAGVSPFSGTVVSTVESSQGIQTLTLTVGNVADGASEIMRIDGSDVSLVNGTSLTTANLGLSVTVSVSGGVATVTLDKSAGITAAQSQALVNGLTYRDLSEAPTAGNRTITLTTVRDTGGVANGGVDSAVLSLASTVNVVAVNDAPILTTTGGSATFSAGDNTPSTPVVVDAGLTLSDVDNTTMASATVRISGNFRSGEDQLIFINNNSTLYGNVTASYNAGTGVMTLTSAGATASVAQWQAALRTVRYTDTAVTPDSATRTISFVVNDGTNDSTAATRNVTVTPVDQSPILGTSGGSSTFTEGQGAVHVDSGVTVSDLDNSTLASASVQITGNLHAGEDLLLFTNTSSTTFGNIVGSYNAGTGTLTLVSAGGTATVAQWQAALRAVDYSNTSGTPDTSVRTVSFSVNDGTKTSATGTRDVQVVSVEIPPVLGSSGGSVSFTEGNQVAGTPVVIDSGLTVSDADSPTLTSATVAVTGNFRAGEDVLGFSNTNSSLYGNILASYNAGTGALTLSSAGATATVAQWQAALRSVTYSNSSDTPGTSTRTISFTVSDGAVSSSTVTRDVTVVAVNDTPQLSGSGGTVVFTEGDNAAPIPIALDATLSLVDPDSIGMGTATIAITGNLHAAEDVLAFRNTDASVYGNLAGSYDAATGVLTLSSAGNTATLAQWQAALRAVSYANTSETPDTSTRVISIRVNDGNSDSNTLVRSVQVTATNDTPVIQLPGSVQHLLQGSTISFASGLGNGISLSDADAGNGLVQVTLTATQGLISLGATSGLSFVAGSGTGDATMTFSGSVADINAALQGLLFRPASGYQGAASITIAADDLGNSGGAARTASSTVALSIDTVSVTTPASPAANQAASTSDSSTLATVQPLPLSTVTAPGPVLLPDGPAGQGPRGAVLSPMAPLTFDSQVQLSGSFGLSGAISGIDALLGRSTPLVGDALDMRYFVGSTQPGEASLNELAGSAGAQGRALQETAALGQYVVAPGQPVSIVLPMESLAGQARNGPVTVEVRMADGVPLPRWLRYDPVNGTLSGQAPAGLAQKVSIEIVVRDAKGGRAVSHVDLEINASADAVPLPTSPLAAPQTIPAGRADLSQQFGQHGQAARETERLQWLQHLAAAQAEAA